MNNVLKFSFLLVMLSMFVACKNDKAADAKVSDKAGEVAKTSGKTFSVDGMASKVIWEGSKLAGAHSGTVDVKDGSVTVSNGMISGGNFSLDMTSITVTDLNEGNGKANLETHLKGTAEKGADDFFNVTKYPTASFEITKVTKRESDPEANILVYGNLTMKNITKEIAFKAQANVKDNMVKVDAPTFKINRTEWGIKYGSPTFFEGLKEKAINDDIALKIDLVAK